MIVPAPSPSGELLAHVISSVGTSDFYEVTLKSLCNYTARQCGEVMVFDRDGPPEILARYPHRSEEICQVYMDQSYRDDPVYRVYKSGGGFGFYSLGLLAPGLGQSDYFEKFYAKSLLFDEIGLLLPLADGRALSIWLGQYDLAERGISRDYSVLGEVAPAIRSLVQRQVSISRPDSITAPLLDKALVAFGSEVISPREQQVTRLLLQGFPANLIGERLGISDGTVRNHKKAIFKKLEIRSKSELFALFMQSVSYWDGRGDPLTSYSACPSPRHGAARGSL